MTAAHRPARDTDGTGDARRPEVAELVALGRVPRADLEDTDTRADRREELLGALHSAGGVTANEARALVTLLPEDDGDAYGVVWTLVHVIESAPGWPLDDALERADGPWAQMLRRRAETSGTDHVS